MKTQLHNMIASGLLLSTFAVTAHAGTDQPAAPIWRAHLTPAHCQVSSYGPARVSNAAVAATPWRQYLPLGPVGTPGNSPYSTHQVQSRIPWSAYLTPPTAPLQLSQSQ